jgi:phosphatidylglycerol---prolipoprotein diacylglyceryl transferase
VIPWFDIKLPSGGPIGIHAFGILVAIGCVVGSKLTVKRGIFDVLLYQGEPDSSVWEYLNPFGGLSSVGGFLGAVVGLVWWTHDRRVSLLAHADSLAYGLAPGWMFGRLGCFTAHDHPERLTDFFLGVHYPDGVRHDLGLDEALWAAGLSAIFILLGRRPRRAGIYLALLALAYAPFRFGLDFLRAADVAAADSRYWGLTPAQYAMAPVLLAGVAVLRHIARRPKRT